METIACPTRGAAYADSQYSGSYVPGNVNDSSSSRWVPNNANAGHWVAITFATPAKLGTITVYTYNNENPVDNTIQYKDEQGAWQSVAQFTSGSFPRAQVVNSTIAATDWRMLVNSAGWLSITWLETTCVEFS